MHFEINVSLNGRHLFATSSRSITSSEEAIRTGKILREKFPKSEGYELRFTYIPYNPSRSWTVEEIEAHDYANDQYHKNFVENREKGISKGPSGYYEEAKEKFGVDKVFEF